MLGADQRRDVPKVGHFGDDHAPQRVAQMAADQPHYQHFRLCLCAPDHPAQMVAVDIHLVPGALAQRTRGAALHFQTLDGS
jgi:hypothetical protein